MRTDTIVPQPPTARSLPALLIAMQRLATLCFDCGAHGTVYADDGSTLLCGRCWLIHHAPSPEGALADYRARASAQLAAATTRADQQLAQFWIDNADRNIAKWEAVQR